MLSGVAEQTIGLPWWLAAAAAKLLQSCLTLCDPMTAAYGVLQARTLEWVAISFSNA